MTSWTFPGCPTPPAYNLDFDAVVRRHPVVAPMASCPQDPVWHAEGDVLTHTRMVCERLVAADDWRRLPSPARQVVFAAALFHDVAKPMVTKLEDGRLRSRGHAVRGARVTRRLLMEAGVRIVHCEAPPDVMRDRNRRRPRPVPDRVIDKLLDHLDVPDETEAHAVTVVTTAGG